MENKKFDYVSSKVAGNHPATILNAALVEMGGRKKVELICAVNVNGEVNEARYYGDIEGEYAANAIKSVVLAGFKGTGWNDLKRGFTNETFDVIPFNVVLEKTKKMDGDKFVSERYDIRFINDPTASAFKKIEGQVNGMDGSFLAAKAKLRPMAQEPSGW